MNPAATEFAGRRRRRTVTLHPPSSDIQPPVDQRLLGRSTRGEAEAPAAPHEFAQPRDEREPLSGAPCAIVGGTTKRLQDGGRHLLELPPDVGREADLVERAALDRIGI